MKMNERFHFKKILSNKRIKSSLWKIEKKLIKKHKNLVAIDEAGRGALAGPLTLGALYLDKNTLKILEKNKIFFFDSKILKPKEREFFKNLIKKIGLKYKVISISNKKIDNIGITKSLIYGIKKIYEYFQPNCLVLDGKPISLRESTFSPRKSAFYFFIKGDQKLCSLGGASILAKTYRDSYMKKISKKFP